MSRDMSGMNMGDSTTTSGSTMMMKPSVPLLLLLPLPSLSPASCRTAAPDDPSSPDDDDGRARYFHGSLGDSLWFSSWSPTTGGGVVACCAVLFFLALVERFMLAVRAAVEVRWRDRCARVISALASELRED